MISEKYKNICVVGDDSQSIYSWRGSNYKNILNFEKDYKNCETVYLEQNYRSTKNIINASNSLIKNNVNRKDKNLWTLNEEGSLIEYKTTLNEEDEAYYVCNEICKLAEQGIKLSDIAVLYRTNAQSYNIEKQLVLNNIPYKVVGNQYFYNRKETKDFLSYLKLICNKEDDVSLTRIINVPKRKIGSSTVEKIKINAIEKNCSMYDAIEEGKELEFKNLIEDLKNKKNEMSLKDFIEYALDKTGLVKELESEKIENQTRIENLYEFKSIASQFEENYGIISLEDFLSEISLVADIQDYKENNEAVTLMTVHLAKGLEFDNVFIIGLEERIFPHYNSLNDEEQIEEERRLCYVAMTRAKKRLWLVNTETRTVFGSKTRNNVSRFINEIDSKYINTTKKIKTNNKVNNIDPNATYNVGDHIIFDLYGSGVIIEVKEKTITVAFPHPHGIKMLIKGHKNIRKV